MHHSSIEDSVGHIENKILINILLKNMASLHERTSAKTDIIF